MSTVRPLRRTDLDALTALRLRAQPGDTQRMPHAPHDVERLFEHLLAPPSDYGFHRGPAMYGMVLTSGANEEVLGCVVLAARAGGDGAYYAFRRDLLRHRSTDPINGHDMQTLTLCAGLTRHADLLRFYLAPDIDDDARELLVHACVLFAASAPARFAPSCLMALPSVQAPFETPFWDAVGGRFFKSDLKGAERALGHTRSHACISKMMPHFPIYVPVLPPAAQHAIGRAGAGHTRMALDLAQYGFSRDRYLDVLHGGPIFIAEQAALAACAVRRRKAVQIETDVAPSGTRYLLANRCEHGFRATLGTEARLHGGAHIALGARLAERLRVNAGDDIVCLPA